MTQRRQSGSGRTRNYNNQDSQNVQRGGRTSAGRFNEHDDSEENFSGSYSDNLPRYDARHEDEEDAYYENDRGDGRWSDNDDEENDRYGFNRNDLNDEYRRNPRTERSDGRQHDYSSTGRGNSRDSSGNFEEYSHSNQNRSNHGYSDQSFRDGYSSSNGQYSGGRNRAGVQGNSEIYRRQNGWNESERGFATNNRPQRQDTERWSGDDRDAQRRNDYSSQEARHRPNSTRSEDRRSHYDRQGDRY